MDRLLAVAALALALTPRVVSAAVTVFANDLAGFNAAAGNPPIVVDFDAIPFGMDIGGTTIGGLTFTPSASGAALVVVEAADTVTPAGFSGVIDAGTNVLPATSGAGALSPGGGVLGPGPDAAVEDDDLVVTFAAPVSAVGFDHLSQSADGAGSTSIAVFGVGDTLLFAGAVPISNLGGGGAPAGADFWGIVSDANDIARIEIDEGDGNSTFPDCNVGYDTFRVASLGGGPTTTTSPASTTTTTVVPTSCAGVAVGPTFASLNCRLAALIAAVQSQSQLGSQQAKLVKAARKAKARKESAEAECAAGDTKASRKQLKKVGRKLIQFSHRLRSNNARRNIPDEVREPLAGDADEIKTDARELMDRLSCAG